MSLLDKGIFSSDESFGIIFFFGRGKTYKAFIFRHLKKTSLSQLGTYEMSQNRMKMKALFIFPLTVFKTCKEKIFQLNIH